MVYCEYKKRGIKIGHLWFYDGDNIDSIHPDILYMHGSKKRKERWDVLCDEQYSLMTDLSISEDELYKNIRKNYRYEIRRSEKENVKLDYYSATSISEEILHQFENTYNEMYKDKNINVTFNRNLVDAYIRDEKICFTIASYNHIPLVFHSYIIDENNVRFFYSTSPFRAQTDISKKIGCMNKALHWYDICLFKSLGVKKYDWGGISNADKPNGIDEFKMGFGGERVVYYNSIVGVSLIGKLAVFLTGLKRKHR